MPWPKGKPRGPQSPEHIARRMAAGAHAKRGVKQTPEHIEKCRQLRIGRKLNVTSARAEATRRRWEAGVYDELFSGKRKFSFGAVAMRSRWEVAFASVFDDQGYEWEYEPKRFTLPSGATYTPDFYLPQVDLWVEVKGYLTPQAKAKFDEFCEMVGRRAVMVIGKDTEDFMDAVESLVEDVDSAFCARAELCHV